MIPMNHLLTDSRLILMVLLEVLAAVILFIRMLYMYLNSSSGVGNMHTLFSE